MTEVRRVEAWGDASGLHVGVAVASWNRSITDNLLQGALDRLDALGVGKVTVLRVPGSLELPSGAAGLIGNGCQAVVALGTIVKGDTDHYAIVSRESARGLTLVANRTGAPIANGILAVHDISLAVDRSQPGPSNKGHEAATAAVEMALGLQALMAEPSAK